MAGGRATRLGPLAAQYNKSLVSVAGKPMLVRQVQQLRQVGCREIVVVVSPGSRDQVQGVIDRAGLPNTRVAVQEQPEGPGRALIPALTTDRSQGNRVAVLMADTLLTDGLAPWEDDIAFVAPAPSERSFCHYDRSVMEWQDGVVREGHDVAIGAFYFSDEFALYAAAVVAAPADSHEVGMAAVLNAYPDRMLDWPEPGWQDVGDVAALARANSNGFISRSFHDLTSKRPGTITKHGDDVVKQVAAMQAAPVQARHLWPQIFEVSSGQYTMEYVDLPSLAELWLYWPSTPDMWRHIGEQLTKQLRENLWPQRGCIDIAHRADRMYVEKLIDRYHGTQPENIDAWSQSSTLWVNGRQLTAGPLLIAHVVNSMQRFVDTANDHRAYLHGDPNFTNVLWSLRTGSFKLIDPRGDWGGPGSWGDSRYDLGKLTYSPTFSAIVSRLFDMELRDDDGWHLDIWPKRVEEELALRSSLGLSVEHMMLLQAYMLLSSAPLHEEPEASALYLTGAMTANWLIDAGKI